MGAAQSVQVLLDDARPGRERLLRFSNPTETICAWHPDEVELALEALEAARRNGRYAAGYFSYELGYVLEPRLRGLLPARREVPLLWFAIFDAFETSEGTAAKSALDAQVAGRTYRGPLAQRWGASEYGARFMQVYALIEAGDIYQANLSFRSHFPSIGDPMALYLQLREQSQAAHCAFIDDGERCILSFSPELFFAISRTGEITARPMKGTAPRGSNGADDVAMRLRLQNSAKDRAENLMIVDLLRNDLGRIARTGSVSVHDLYAVETYPTVHQMVSTVRAQMKAGTTVADLCHALFPCGSVTGTPKIRAMEVIRDLEADPRGVYCGAIGHFAPDGSASFNVAIRTLTIAGTNGVLGVGGAIVHDSNAASEYGECLLKARYYDATRRPLDLIETLRFSPVEGFVRRDLHLSRLERSAAAFAFPFDRASALNAMRSAVSGKMGDQRIRLTLSEDGTIACTSVPLPVSPTVWRYSVSPISTSSRDVLLRYKTSWRELYEAELDRAHGCDEVLFVNEQGRLTEGSRSNIFVRRHGQLITPPLEEGVLDGCLRRELIDGGLCMEGPLYLRDLEGAKVFLGNSLRGLIVAVHGETAG